MQDPAIDYASSRTLELHFCSHILLPDEELQAHAPAPLPTPATTAATFEPVSERKASVSAPQTPSVAPEAALAAHFTT